MARQNAHLLAFSRGEVSRIALARIDIEKLRLAAECQLNWQPWIIGAMMLRQGLQHIDEIRGDAPCTLVPFVYSKTDTALIELVAGVMRVRINDVLISRVAVGTAISDPSFGGGGTWSTADTTSGATATIASGVCTLAAPPVGGLARIKQTIAVAGGDQGKEHGLRIVVLNGPVTIRIGTAAGLSDVLSQSVIDTGTHSLAFTPTTSSVFLQIETTDAWNKTLTQCTIEAAGVMELPTPWGANDLANIRYDPAGDILFVASYGLQQRKIERRGVRPGARGWSVVLYRSGSGPFLPSPTIEANLRPSVYFGNGTLTSDQPFFQPGHVGALFRLFSNGQANDTVLGAQNAFTTAARVTGVGTTARNYDWAPNSPGGYVGQLTLQRSFDGPNAGFTDVSTASSGSTSNIQSRTGGTGSTPDLDNIIAWERVGFKAGNYTSGNVEVQATGPGQGFSLSPLVPPSFNSGGRWGTCRVTAYNSATSVNIEVLDPFSSITATTDWQEAAWSGVYGWPTSVRFHEGRLWWFGGGPIPIAGSQSNNYTGFAEEDNLANPLGDAAAILEDFGSGPRDVISWGLSLTRLLLGREMSIASCRSGAFDTVLTPADFSVKDCSTQGAARLPAIKVDTRGIFVQQSGRRVYELGFRGYNAEGLDYAARDLTRLNLDIGKPGFVDIDIAHQPDKQIFLPKTDGQVAVLLYDADDQVEAWWRAQTLGVIENVRVLPTGTGTEDQVYFVVNRTINGTTRRFLEKLALRDNCVGGSVNQQLDCHLLYQGSPVSTVTLSWLPNTTVSIWADGQSRGTVLSDGSGVVALGGSYSNVVVGLAGSLVSASSATLTATLSVGTAYNGYPAEVWADVGGTGELTHLGPVTVASGNVTLPNGAQALTIVAALGYVAPFQSAKLAYAAQMGSPLTQKKRIDHVGLVMYDTHYQGLQFGQRLDVLDALPAYDAGQVTPAGTIWASYDQPMTEVPGDWDTDARLVLLAQAPLPCKVGAVAIGITTNEKS